MKFTFLALSASVFVLSCDSPSDPLSDVLRVEISPSSNTPIGMIALRTAEEFQLRSNVTRADGTTAAYARVMWGTSNAQIATVDTAGLVRTAATYAACSNYSFPFGCGVSIIARAGSLSDTVLVLVQPRIEIDGTPEITFVAGDSVNSLSVPIASVDGEIRCTFFLWLVYPQEVVRRSSSGHVLAVGPGEGYLDWMPAHNLCRGMGYRTTVHVLPANAAP